MNNLPNWVIPTQQNGLTNAIDKLRQTANVQPPIQSQAQAPGTSVPPQQQKPNAQEALQQFFQMLMSGGMQGMKGFKGFLPVDHNPFENMGQNVNPWGTNDTGLGMYGANRNG